MPNEKDVSIPYDPELIQRIDRVYASQRLTPKQRQARRELEVNLADAEATLGGSPLPAEVVNDSGAWVTAATLWREKFGSRKEMEKFRSKHPEMFRNPSPNRLEIHSGKWTRYWADRDKAGFNSLDGELPSVADDPRVQDQALLEAAARAKRLREKKRREKQPG